MAKRQGESEVFQALPDVQEQLSSAPVDVYRRMNIMGSQVIAALQDKKKRQTVGMKTVLDTVAASQSQEEQATRLTEVIEVFGLDDQSGA